MPKVKALIIFPIKGMRGISVDSANLEPEGFQFDRRWMLVDTNGVFISQRTHPLLTQFIPAIEDSLLTIRYQQSSISIPLDKYSKDIVNVSVFDDSMQANCVSTECDQWFSSHLNQEVRLVRVSRSTNRIKDFAKYLSPENGDYPTATVVSFADGYPYLVLGTASMSMLNAKLKAPLNIDRFRANIIVETDEAHVEDKWTHLSVGSQQMMMVKPCARCQVPTIDQISGKRSKEPNTTLASYRVRDKKVYFGMNAIALSFGKISVGDPITF